MLLNNNNNNIYNITNRLFIILSYSIEFMGAFMLLIENIKSYFPILYPVSSFYRSEGEKVRVGDDLILVSVATERYLVRFSII